MDTELRCMIQDIFEMEYFPKSVTVVNSSTGQSRQIDLLSNPDFTLDVDESTSNVEYGCRLPVYVVPIPGESDWFRTIQPVISTSNEALKSICNANIAFRRNTSASTSRDRSSLRKLGGSESLYEEIPSTESRSLPFVREAVSIPVSSSFSSPSKVESSLQPGEKVAEGVTLTAKGGQVFSAHLSDSVDNLMGCSAALDNRLKMLNLPHKEDVDTVSGAPHSFVLFILDDEEKWVHQLRINDCLIVKGNVQSFSSSACEKEKEENADWEMEANPLSAISEMDAPRITVSCVSKINDKYFVAQQDSLAEKKTENPSVPSNQQADLSKVVNSLSMTSVSECFKTVFGDDGVVRKALLAALSSNHTEFKDGSLTRGHITVSLLDVSANHAHAIVSLLKSLLPCVVHLPLSTQALNSATWSPFKDYESNRLVAGRLQIPNHAVLVIDETQLDEGHLSSIGLSNVHAIKKLIEEHTLSVPYGPSEVTLPLNCKIVDLAGQNSIFQKSFDLIVPCVALPNRATKAVAISDETRMRARTFLTCRCLPFAEISIPEATGKHIEEYFVSEREKNRSSVGEEELHLWLSIAKTFTISLYTKLDYNMGIEEFNEAVALYKQANERMILRKRVEVKGEAGEEIDLDD
eukprot:GDKJ01028678.1.p1 GENE.GDKJ01028678.1~~GDKJ01028678.1.p1  ORF type:complete len:635 (+),score=151.34 GDKJ01028678.1:41-1945(+)